VCCQQPLSKRKYKVEFISFFVLILHTEQHILLVSRMHCILDIVNAYENTKMVLKLVLQRGQKYKKYTAK
jgi:hypothetical protein